MSQYQFEDVPHSNVENARKAELYKASKRRVLAKLSFYIHLVFALLVMGMVLYSKSVSTAPGLDNLILLTWLIPLGLHFLTAFVFSPYRTKPRSRKKIELNLFNSMVEKEMRNMKSKGYAAEEQWPPA